jgi:hypothetical protein
MIGGKVIQVTDHGRWVKLWLVDNSPNAHYGFQEEATILVDKSKDDAPEVGDVVWWQSGNAYWTTADGMIKDKQLKMHFNPSNPIMHLDGENRDED